MPIAREKRNVAVLAAAQALFMTGATMLIIISGLVGFALAENKALATLPVSAAMIGNALTMVPASLLMERVGRRPGFILGALIGVFGAAVAAMGIFERDFALFVVGNVIIGIYAGFAQYYRFAAADESDPDFKGTAISLVLTGGVVAALVGPELAKWSSGLLAPPRFLVSYLVVAGLALAAAAVLWFLDIPRIRKEEISEPGRPLRRIMRQPVFLVAVFVGMMGYGVTILMMTAVPLAMAAYRHGLDHTAFVIQWHTVAMFAPAFFTGSLIRKFGVLNVMFIGTALLAGCVVAALAGVDLLQFFLGLTALGLGWNFTFIGASTLLIEAYLPAERAKVQAANDFLVFGSVATASLLSGALLDYVDWRAVNYFAVPFLLAAAGAVSWLAISRQVGRRPALDSDGGSVAVNGIGLAPAPTAWAKGSSGRTGISNASNRPFHRNAIRGGTL
jgi:MFS family permease